MNDEALRQALRPAGTEQIPADGHTILKRVQVRDRLVRGGVGGAAVIALLTVTAGAMLIGPDEDLTPRGLGAVPPAVELDWLVEGATVTRGTSAPVAADQDVIFHASTSAAGFLCLDERDDDGAWQRLFPFTGGSWEAPAGDTLLTADGAPQSFHTGLGDGPRRYRLTLDLEDADCQYPSASTEVEIEWAP